MNALDPLAPSIEEALEAGWFLVPQIRDETSDNALVWFGHGFTYVVTIPLHGAATVVFFEGGPPPGHPRRPAREPWRHRVPVDVALGWALSGPEDDRALREWRHSQGRHR
jgi:hypothetical protein